MSDRGTVRSSDGQLHEFEASAKIGPLELSVSDVETINVPAWAGVGAIVVGGTLLLVTRKGLAAA